MNRRGRPSPSGFLQSAIVLSRFKCAAMTQELTGFRYNKFARDIVQRDRSARKKRGRILRRKFYTACSCTYWGPLLVKRLPIAGRSLLYGLRIGIRNPVVKKEVTSFDNAATSDRNPTITKQVHLHSLVHIFKRTGEHSCVLLDAYRISNLGRPRRAHGHRQAVSGRHEALQSDLSSLWSSILLLSLGA